MGLKDREGRRVGTKRRDQQYSAAGMEGQTSRNQNSHSEQFRVRDDIIWVGGGAHGNFRKLTCPPPLPQTQPYTNKAIAVLHTSRFECVPRTISSEPLCLISHNYTAYKVTMGQIEFPIFKCERSFHLLTSISLESTLLNLKLQKWYKGQLSRCIGKL